MEPTKDKEIDHHLLVFDGTGHFFLRENISKGTFSLRFVKDSSVVSLSSLSKKDIKFVAERILDIIK